MKLYWSRMSPFVRKVMVVAHEAGITDRLTLEDIIVAMSAANPMLLPNNPLSQIPTLVFDDGRTLHDSRVICEYLDTLGEAPRLFPAEGPARWDALKRQALGDGLLQTLILWRQERLKPEQRQMPEWLETFAIKVATALDQLDCHVDDFAALPFDIGHAAIGCALGYIDFRFADLDWREGRQALAGWQEAFERRPAAIATSPGKPK